MRGILKINRNDGPDITGAAIWRSFEGGILVKLSRGMTSIRADG
jgi:hypothetical protein